MTPRDDLRALANWLERFADGIERVDGDSGPHMQECHGARIWAGKLRALAAAQETPQALHASEIQRAIDAADPWKRVAHGTPQPPIEPDNHHNALACPYCNPKREQLCPDPSRHQPTAARASKPQHVCGLAGYNGMIDPPCPACQSAAQETPQPQWVCDDCGETFVEPPLGHNHSFHDGSLSAGIRTGRIRRIEVQETPAARPACTCATAPNSVCAVHHRATSYRAERTPAPPATKPTKPMWTTRAEETVVPNDTGGYCHFYQGRCSFCGATEAGGPPR